MKKMVIIILLLTSCNEPALQVSNTNNRNFDVGLLFTHEGCSVFRFRDAGRDKYFVKCEDGSAETNSDYTEMCGKNCFRTESENIQTF